MKKLGIILLFLALSTGFILADDNDKLAYQIADNTFFDPTRKEQTKELDDNSQSKNDRKDPKVIPKLVLEGRYSAPYTPDGVYADLRIMVANRKRLIREITQIKNRFARWFAIYFPEYADVFGDYEAQSSMLLLKKACTPEAIVELGAEKINQIWRDAKLRAVGMKRATTLCTPSWQSHR